MWWRTWVRRSRFAIRKLRTLTRAACYHPFPSFLLREARHKIVSASDLEAEDFLQIFSFQPYLIAQPCTESRTEKEWCLFQDFVNF